MREQTSSDMNIENITEILMKCVRIRDVPKKFVTCAVSVICVDVRLLFGYRLWSCLKHTESAFLLVEESMTILSLM